jgi:site-specific DNA-cytosine methylase
MVPGNVDVLIAGTSCVDYSNLNNNQLDINAGGESGRTFHGMLAWVIKHRPTIVLLENVCSAPWADVVKAFQDENYSAIHQRFDTKNYYIPHTRLRGYMMAVDSKKGSMVDKWKAKVTQLARPASSTLDAFLLESDDPRIYQARQKLVHEFANHERKAGYDWGRCELRHQKARIEEELGSKRPLTGWEEGALVLHLFRPNLVNQSCIFVGGTSRLPSYAWNDWGVTQVDRVWDLMDITTLRAACLGKDPLFKTCVLPFWCKCGASKCNS